MAQPQFEQRETESKVRLPVWKELCDNELAVTGSMPPEAA